MSNMSYCRWFNTASDMEDCVDSIEELEQNANKRDHGLSSEERQSLQNAVELAARMISEMPADLLLGANIDFGALDRQEDVEMAENYKDAA